MVAKIKLSRLFLFSLKYKIYEYHNFTESIIEIFIFLQGELRVAKKDYESEDARKYGGIDLWHHLECFAQVRQELEFWESGSQLPGFKSLLKEDQAKVEETLPKIEP